MVRDKMQRLAAATGAALLAVSAAVPLDVASAQSPRSTQGRQAPGRMTASANATGPSIIAPTSNPELVFVPIQPCRAFATGSSNGGGAIAVDTTRNFYVAGTTGFDTQGGASGGCGIPASATAVAITVTAYNISSATNGKVIAYPYGNTLPSTVAVSFSPNINQTSNVTVGVNQSRISLQAKNNSIQVAGDITGYYAPQMQAYVQADGTIYSGTTRMISSARPDTGQYTVVVDRDIYTCTLTVTPATIGPFIAVGYGDKENTARIFLYTLSNGAFSPVNIDFNIIILC